jgi:hypothetical protein
MLKVSKQWIADQALIRPDVLDHILPAAGKLLHDARDFISTFPEDPLSPAELLLATRPPSFKQYDKPDQFPEKLTACTKWFAHWLACCAPRDEDLQDEVLRTIMNWAEVSLPIPQG